MSNITYVYAVVYVGPPYGLDESGEILSLHRSLEHAIRYCFRARSNPRYYGRNTIVKRKPIGQNIPFESFDWME
mgnify:CR=1 FL=1